MTNRSSGSWQQRARLTFGVLAGWQAYEEETPNRFLESIYRGIYRYACTHDCNVLFAGGVRRLHAIEERHPAWPEYAEETDFVPITPERCDGFIVLPPLSSAARWDYLTGLEAQGLPLVFLGSHPVQSCVMIDNEGGIRQALAHLLAHGHRQIAFIAGEASDSSDSAERLTAYRRLLGQEGIAYDPCLVAYGDHTVGGGQEAIATLLARGVPFSAVIVSNDPSAFGAMQALEAAGLAVPHDVAVIGFDDQRKAIAHLPPLTTVRYPLEQAGYTVAELLQIRIQQPDAPPVKKILPARLIRRRSCGCCTAAIVLHAATPGTPFEPEALARQMVARLEELSDAPAPSDGLDLARHLVEGLAAAVAGNTPEPFFAALESLVASLERQEASSHAWQVALADLRTAWLPQTERQTLLEDTLQRAHLTLSEAAERGELRRRVQAEEAANGLSRVITQLHGALNESELLEGFAQAVTQVGIAWAHVGLFGAENAPLPVAPMPEGEAVQAILVPLVFQNEQLGVVTFEAGNLEPCGLLTRQLAVALQRTRLHEQVLALSFTDSLTGLYNRRYLELFLVQEIEAALRYERPLSLLLLDIDHFKSYNDSFGHPAGDRALQRVAACLKATCRDSDIPLRYGGEEFAIVLRDTPLEGALRIAERVLLAVAALASCERPLTVSIGVTHLKGSATLETLIQEADDALYCAKNAGRNRVSGG